MRKRDVSSELCRVPLPKGDRLFVLGSGSGHTSVWTFLTCVSAMFHRNSAEFRYQAALGAPIAPSNCLRDT
ncbi:hypothetical protein BH10PLA2_BH10PLA2_25650 [soil metagenome]